MLDVLDLLTPVFKIGRIWQANEFVGSKTEETVARFAKSFGEIPLTREAHVDFKKRVPQASAPATRRRTAISSWSRRERAQRADVPPELIGFSQPWPPERH